MTALLQMASRPSSESDATPFVLNLCSSTTPMALAHPETPELKRFTFFVSRRREEGRERFRLHMGYFSSLAEAEEWLSVVRDVYPGAWAGEAPGKRLRERAAAAAAAASPQAATLVQKSALPKAAPAVAVPISAARPVVSVTPEVAPTPVPSKPAPQAEAAKPTALDLLVPTLQAAAPAREKAPVVEAITLQTSVPEEHEVSYDAEIILLPEDVLTPAPVSHGAAPSPIAKTAAAARAAAPVAKSQPAPAAQAARPVTQTAVQQPRQQSKQQPPQQPAAKAATPAAAPQRGAHNTANKQGAGKSAPVNGNAGVSANTGRGANAGGAVSAAPSGRSANGSAGRNVNEGGAVSAASSGRSANMSAGRNANASGVAAIATPASAANAESSIGAKKGLTGSNVREVLASLDETGDTRMMPAAKVPNTASTASVKAVSLRDTQFVEDDPTLSDTQVLNLLETRRADGSESKLSDLDTGGISVLRPDDTVTRRALKEAVVQNAPVSFAVQLLWAVQPVELDKVPPLAIFSAYTLYTVEGSREGRKWYGLRLGFFSDAISAKQVAYYVRSEFTAVAVVPVGPEERSRALDDENTTAVALSPKQKRDGVVDEFKLFDDEEEPAPRVPAVAPAVAASLAAALDAAFPETKTAPMAPAAAKSAPGRSGLTAREPTISSTATMKAPAVTARPAPPPASNKRNAPRPGAGKVNARDRRSAQTLEETLEILGASQLEIDDGNGVLLNDTGVRHLRVEVQKNTPFSRLLERLSERVRKP